MHTNIFSIFLPKKLSFFHRPKPVKKQFVNAAMWQCRKARHALRRAGSHSECFCAGRQCPVPNAQCLAKRHCRITELPNWLIKQKSLPLTQQG
jgi:hypothetical protein